MRSSPLMIFPDHDQTTVVVPADKHTHRRRACTPPSYVAHPPLARARSTAIVQLLPRVALSKSTKYRVSVFHFGLPSSVSA